MRTRAVINGRHTRKTGAFVRVSVVMTAVVHVYMYELISTLQACIAYSFITIPSIDNSVHRLNLFLISGRVAVANGALSQGALYVLEMFL